MNSAFTARIEELMEKHLPIGFLDYDSVTHLKDIICTRESIGRKELLTFAYIIGADSKESNDLLTLAEHPPLYVKKREDAIWKFMLDNHVDSAFVMSEIFLQNVEER